jgi:hypothetical protein
MTLSKNLDVNNFDALHEWIPEAREETDVEEEVLWNIAEKLLLEPESMAHIEKELRLKVLYEIHLNRIQTNNQDPLGSWVTIHFTVEGRKEQIQFSYGQYSVPLNGGDYDAEAMKRITREEDLEVDINDPDVIKTRATDHGPVQAVEITRRILEEVYGASLVDVTWAEEEGVRELSWDDVIDDR